MQSFLCDRLVELNAHDSHESKDVQALLNDLHGYSDPTVVVLKHAHFLTTAAFLLLHQYLQQKPQNISFVLESSDRSRIFPPLLEYLGTTEG